MFQYILVPLDGSLRAEQALPVAAQIARFTGGSLLLVRVVSLATDYSGGWAPTPMENQQEIDEEIGSARHVSEIAGDIARAYGHRNEDEGAVWSPSSTASCRDRNSWDRSDCPL